MFYILSTLNITRVELHKIPTDQPMRRPKNPSASTVLWKVFIQHIFQAVAALSLAISIRPPPDQLPKQMESWPVILIKLAIAAILLDTYQYWMHRWMHLNRTLYKYLHSVHHQLTAPYAFGALYNHPLEGLVMDTVGGAVPSLLLDMHPWTSTLFFTLATLKTVDDHCGYSLPWDPFQALFQNNAAYHDKHHWGKGIKYNFSQPFFHFWDIWMGTDFDMAMEKLKPKHYKGSVSSGSDSDEDEKDERFTGNGHANCNGTMHVNSNGTPYMNGNGTYYMNGSRGGSKFNGHFANGNCGTTTPLRRSPRMHASS
ncbi:hypothetical protein SeLEV6574_g00264 [Synchytrium endobioticum]|uniref:Fatty acid hydroxylase domain-containing protein n=1 Tax=Synchytrium endobioticum TaxID=286115 RepID=A0A507DIS5_9FUNG|nr:hypothetical protein SeLEV6574_g00264 [Synchytrium endobioticum]